MALNKNQLVFLFCLLLAMPSHTQPFLSENHYKACQAREVYNQIVQASGSEYQQPPNLKISKRASRVAAYNPEGMIILDERAYDICMNQADSLSALAWVIGHEFSHFFQKHGENDNRLRGIVDAAKNHPIQYFQEKEADIVGAFYARLSGYEPESILDNLFDELYISYQLKNTKNANYRDIKERKQSAKEAFDFAEKLWLIHETAGLLVATGQYESAADCYLYLSEYLESPDLHNNLALTWLQYVVSSNSKNDEYPFIYPFDLAKNERLEILLKRDDLHNKWLQLAEEHLKKAMHLNAYFFPAHINFLCLLIFKNEPEEVIKKSDDWIQKFTKSREKALINVAKGIAFAKMNQKIKAVNAFKDAQGSDIAVTKIAIENLGILNGDYITRFENLAHINAPQSVINELEDFAFSPSELNEEIYISNFSDIRYATSFLSKKSHQGFIVLHRENYQKRAFYFTRSKGTKSPKGIRVGQSSALVLKKNGAPRYFFGQGGELMIFDKKGLFFKIKDGKVVGWGGWK